MMARGINLRSGVLFKCYEIFIVFIFSPVVKGRPSKPCCQKFVVVREPTPADYQHDGHEGVAEGHSQAACPGGWQRREEEKAANEEAHKVIMVHTSPWTRFIPRAQF